MIPASFSTSRLWLISEERFSQFICMHTAKNGACPESTWPYSSTASMELLTQYLGLWLNNQTEESDWARFLPWSNQLWVWRQSLTPVGLPLPGTVGGADSLRRACGWEWNNYYLKFPDTGHVEVGLSQLVSPSLPPSPPSSPSSSLLPSLFLPSFLPFSFFSCFLFCWKFRQWKTEAYSPYFKKRQGFGMWQVYLSLLKMGEDGLLRWSSG